VALNGKVRDKSLDFLGSHVFGVAFFVKEDVALDPVFVGVFGAIGVVFDADGVADLVEEFSFFWGHLRRFFHIDLLSICVYNLVYSNLLPSKIPDRLGYYMVACRP